MRFKITLLSIGCLILAGACQSTKPAAVNVEAQERPLAKNIILMIGDGMGLTAISAAMLSSDKPLAMEKFPVIGLHRSSCLDDLITDSAASATAMACGIKTNKFAIGVDKDSLPCRTIIEQAEAIGMATGIIVTSTIVHATPAAFVSHQPLRAFYEAIAEDIARSGVDFIVGGGRQYFDQRKGDDRNLIQELENRGYRIHDYRQSPIEHLQIDPINNFVYFTSDKDPVAASLGRKYLPYATDLGLQFLRGRSRKGFFLLIEGSQIDWAGHGKDATGIVSETLDFDQAVARVLKFAQKRDDTLVIVTADHETGGLAISSESKFGDIKLNFTTNEHTPALVPVLAYGPGAEYFAGIYENSDIYFKMCRALGWEEKTVETGMSVKAK